MMSERATKREARRARYERQEAYRRRRQARAVWASATLGAKRLRKRTEDRLRNRQLVKVVSQIADPMARLLGQIRALADRPEPNPGNVSQADGAPKRGIGRPSKFNAIVAAQAIWMAERGASRLKIAQELRIGQRTFDDWLADPRKADFAKRFRDAEARAWRSRCYLRSAIERRKARASWAKFRDGQEGYWLKRLGPVEFWRRRVAWFERRNLERVPSYGRACAELKRAMERAEEQARLDREAEAERWFESLERESIEFEGLEYDED